MKEDKRRRTQLILFVLTFFTTTAAGAEWMYGHLLIFGDLSWAQFWNGMEYSVPFLLILTCHEFGHYLTARYHNIKVTLPYYLPVWLFGFIPLFGTFGAFIRIQEAIESRTKYFDVGVAGPIAGFVIALGVIWYGFANLPEPEYIYEIHPEYELFGSDFSVLYDIDTVIYKEDLPNPDRINYASMPDSLVIRSDRGVSFQFGPNLLFYLMEEYVVEDKSRIPHPNEMIHYPWLMVGFLALLFTSLNLLPIGQLDGGHVIFSVFGERLSRRISEVLFTLFVFYAGLGVISPDSMQGTADGAPFRFLLKLVLYVYFLFLCFTSMIESRKNRLMLASIILALQYVCTALFKVEGYYGWMLFSLLIGRFIGVYHPPVADNRPLTKGRIAVAILALVIFILSFSPYPLITEV
jgi:membrane-associated protease RseP (regulator of RpoE activity)